MRLLLALLLSLCFTLHSFQGTLLGEKEGRSERTLKQEEEIDYYKKWHREDVLYIISPEEESVFTMLTTDDEKDAFIEQFWLRRDPDLNTSQNEFKEEHYRRIAYANERFYAGVNGWVTDRGRVYITMGPADEVYAKPAGGRYQREIWEGGGITNVYPFERWWYRHVEGVGSDIEIEFVDKCMCNDYVLAMDMWEKDAENIGGAENTGLTMDEIAGGLKKRDRPYFNPGQLHTGRGTSMRGMRQKDMPFQRLDTYFKVLSPPKIKFKDLQANIESRVFFEQLTSLRYKYDFIRLNRRQFLIPITVQFDNKEFQFSKMQLEDQEFHRAHVSLYARVTTLAGRLQTEVEDEIVIEYQPNEIEQGRTQQSMYQKMIVLPPGLFKLELVIKDTKSGKLSSLQGGISVPRIEEEKLQSSSLILAQGISGLPRLPDGPEMFVLGDLKVFPSVDRKFAPDRMLNVYLNLYNAAIDQSSGAPELEISYEILKGSEVIERFQDRRQSVYSSSEARTILLMAFPLQTLKPGSYKLRVKAVDMVKQEQVQLEETFTITS